MKKLFLFALILNLTTVYSFWMPPDPEDEKFFNEYGSSKSCRPDNENLTRDDFIGIASQEDEVELEENINREHDRCHEIYDRYIRDLKAGNDTVWIVNSYNSLNRNLLSNEINTCDCYNEIQKAANCINKFLRKYSNQVNLINERNNQNRGNVNPNTNK